MIFLHPDPAKSFGFPTLFRGSYYRYLVFRPEIPVYFMAKMSPLPVFELTRTYHKKPQELG
jgi:hypothetical protein